MLLGLVGYKPSWEAQGKAGWSWRGKGEGCRELWNFPGMCEGGWAGTQGSPSSREVPIEPVSWIRGSAVCVTVELTGHSDGLRWGLAGLGKDLKDEERSCGECGGSQLHLSFSRDPIMQI